MEWGPCQQTRVFQKRGFLAHLRVAAIRLYSLGTFVEYFSAREASYSRFFALIRGHIPF
jgi:hypothetical protein